MLKQKEIVEIFKEVVLEDERFWYPNADVFSNAVLALIQVDLKSKFDVYCDILELDRKTVKKDWKKSKTINLKE